MFTTNTTTTSKTSKNQNIKECSTTIIISLWCYDIVLLLLLATKTTTTIARLETISRLRACGQDYLKAQLTWCFAQGKQESERTLSQTRLFAWAHSKVSNSYFIHSNSSHEVRLFSSALVVLAWSWCSRHRGTREFYLVEAEFLLRFLLCMMLQELREAIQTYLARGDSNSLCRGRHNRGFSVFIPFQVCAFLLRAWCCRSYAKRSRQLSEHTKKEFQEVFSFAELSSEGA